MIRLNSTQRNEELRWCDMIPVVAKFILPIFMIIVAIEYRRENQVNQRYVVWLIVTASLLLFSFCIQYVLGPFYDLFQGRESYDLCFSIIQDVIFVILFAWFVYGLIISDLRPNELEYIHPILFHIFQGILYGYIGTTLVFLLCIRIVN